MSNQEEKKIQRLGERQRDRQTDTKRGENRFIVIISALERGPRFRETAGTEAILIGVTSLST